jgi:hypothetical protein
MLKYVYDQVCESHEHKMQLLHTALEYQPNVAAYLLANTFQGTEFSLEDIHELLATAVRFNVHSIRALQEYFKDIDINYFDPYDNSQEACERFPLAIAAASNTKSLKYLIAEGAEINTKHSVLSPLESAVFDCKKRNIVVLLKAGADIYHLPCSETVCDGSLCNGSIIEYAIKNNIACLPLIFEYSKKSIDLHDKRLNHTGKPFIVQLAESENIAEINAATLKKALELLDEGIEDINVATGDGMTFIESYIHYLDIEEFSDEDSAYLYDLFDYLFCKRSNNF